GSGRSPRARTHRRGDRPGPALPTGPRAGGSAGSTGLGCDGSDVAAWLPSSARLHRGPRLITRESFTSTYANDSSAPPQGSPAGRRLGKYRLGQGGLFSVEGSGPGGVPGPERSTIDARLGGAQRLRPG